MLDDATSTSTATGSYVGYVESVLPDRIEGWAINRRNLDDHPRVQAVLDGKIIGTAKCDLYREHVAKAGAGDGRYGFTIKLKKVLAPERLAEIAVTTCPPDGTPPVRLLTTRATSVRMQGTTGVGTPTTTANLELVFDVSDLVQYFRHARLPTGIQRVQIEVINNLSATAQSQPPRIACFTKETDFWVELPSSFFARICNLSRSSGETEAPEWQQVLEELDQVLKQAAKFRFSRGAYLINLGTSWWLQNYFLNVRAAKERYRIRYVPFVHDCIPVMTPEHCTEALTKDFISWIQGAFQHADHIFVNSQATAADVKAVARYLGHEIPDPAIIKLDADYRSATRSAKKISHGDSDGAIFIRNNLRPGSYVLFVSTIESRKNHTLAFSAWLKLIKKHGLAKIPHLVCVGNRGWLNDAAYSKLASSELLRQRILMLSKISDADLEQLYAGSRFTIYPSSYEGWGLPVTESLCYGKVPLLADNSSLPEAGGSVADYFDLGSENDFIQKLERLIFDESYRHAREAQIAAEFRPRSWNDIAQNMVNHVLDWQVAETGPSESSHSWIFKAEPGCYHELAENRQLQLSPQMRSGELFRQGDGWWWPEPWGCWTKDRPGRLAFTFESQPGKGAILFLGIRGVQGQFSTATITIENLCERSVALGPEQDQWLIFRVESHLIERLARTDGSSLFELLCSSDRAADFRKNTNGADPRIAGLGVRGFMVCDEDDFAARLKFLESVALNDMLSLTTRSMLEAMDAPAVWSQHPVEVGEGSAEAIGVRSNAPSNDQPKNFKG